MAFSYAGMAPSQDLRIFSSVRRENFAPASADLFGSSAEEISTLSMATVKPEGRLLQLDVTGP